MRGGGERVPLGRIQEGEIQILDRRDGGHIGRDAEYRLSAYEVGAVHEQSVDGLGRVVAPRRRPAGH